jgi:hypothetical protein
VRKFLVTTIVLVIVVGGGLFAMDRVAASYAESQVAEKVSQEVAANGLTSQPPSVTVGGFPFLTQVMAGQYDEITIGLRDLSNKQITLPLMTIVATDVDAPLDTVRSGSGKIIAAKVVGDSTVPWEAVRNAIGQDGLVLTGDDSGQVTLSGKVALAGFEVALTGTGKVAISNGKVRFSITKLTTTDASVSAQVQRLIDQYRSNLSYEFTVPKLPYNLKLVAVQASAAGVHINAEATDVVLAQ